MMLLRTVTLATGLACAACVTASGAAKPVPVERCAEVQLPADFDPSSPASVERAVRSGPRLLYALGAGRRPALKRLLADGDNPNVCVLGISLLSLSAFSGNAEEVAMLLDGGAHPDKPRDSLGGTPLFAAIGAGHFGVAQLLLARGADPRRTTDGGMTALHQLAVVQVAPGSAMQTQQHELANELLRRGVPVNAQLTIPRTTPLMLAALQGNADLVALLLAQGADPALRSARGDTALSFAQKKKHEHVARLLGQPR